MKKYLLILLNLICCISLSAQVTEKGAVMSVGPGESVLTLHVRDKVTGEPMSGAAIFLSCQQDTLKTITDDYGFAYIDRIPFHKGIDSVQVDLSFIGYKSLKYKYLHKSFTSLDAEMEEDPEQLSEIIVKADAVAMVVRGDTTIFNSEAFVTMDGDNLASLLRKLPGITMNDGKLFANGKPVSKILVNGAAMFNTNLAAAMELVKSDEVKRVKVYDQYDQNRLIEADTLKSKERVVDIETKKPMDILQRTTLLAAAGIYTDENKERHHDFIAGIGGDYNRYGADIPSYSLKADVGHNLNYQTPAPNPSNTGNLYFSANRSKPYQSNYFHTLTGNWRTSDSENYYKHSYTPTAFFKEKSIENSYRNRQNTLGLNYFGNMGWNIQENNSLNLALGLNYSREGVDNLNKTDNLTDGERFFTNISSDGLTRSFGASGSLSFTHQFEKPQRSLMVNLGGGYNQNNGLNHRVDTSAVTTVAQWIRENQTGKSGFGDVNIQYAEPLGERWNLTLFDAMRMTLSHQERLSFDRLLEQTDSLNTYDYHHRELRNTLRAGVDFHNAKHSFNLKLNVDYQVASQLREDHFPVHPDYLKTYHHVCPAVNLNYYDARVNIYFNYNENQNIPSLEDTRDVLDNSSPLFLRAGNPDLKQNIWRNGNLSIGFNFPKLSSSMRLLLNVSSTTNCITRKRIYFNEDTYLPEYDYTAMAGSQLSLPVNLKYDMNLISSLDWSVYVSPINTSMHFGPSYNCSLSPFMTGEEAHMTTTHDLGVNLSFGTNISRYVELMMDSRTGFGLNQLDGDNVYRSLSENLSGSVRVNLFERFWIHSDFDWNWMGTDEENAPGFHRENWNAGISYRFGKQKALEVGLDYLDILNRNNNWITSIEENYISSSFSTIYGTSVILNLKYEF